MKRICFISAELKTHTGRRTHSLGTHSQHHSRRPHKVHRHRSRRNCRSRSFRSRRIRSRHCIRSCHSLRSHRSRRSRRNRHYSRRCNFRSPSSWDSCLSRGRLRFPRHLRYVFKRRKHKAVAELRILPVCPAYLAAHGKPRNKSNHAETRVGPSCPSSWASCSSWPRGLRKAVLHCG